MRETEWKGSDIEGLEFVSVKTHHILAPVPCLSLAAA